MISLLFIIWGIIKLDKFTNLAVLVPNEKKQTFEVVSISLVLSKDGWLICC